MSLSFRFGTVGSPKSTPKRPGGSPGAIVHLNSLGLNALELAWVRSVRVSEASCEKIRLLGIENDVALSVHAPYYINLNATEEEWPKSRKRLMDACHFGNLAGATDIIFHPGSYFKQPAEVVLKKAIPRLKGVADELKANNNPVTLRPETMGKSAMLGSLEDTIEMGRAVPGVLPCVDIAHLHARPGDGTVNTTEEFTEILTKIRDGLGQSALERMHIHISGIEYGPKGEKNHLMLDESDLRYQDFLNVLETFGCAGRMVCESPIMEDDSQMLRDKWAAKTA